MVAKLSRQAFVAYEVPSLKAALAVAFLHNVATQESVLAEGHGFHLTHVQETTQGLHLIVGGFAPDGLGVGGTAGRWCDGSATSLEPLS